MKKKKKRKHSSDPSNNNEDDELQSQQDDSQHDSKSKPKKKKKLEAPKGPTRWDDVNVEADRRYFDVSDNIESTGTTSAVAD